MLNGWVVYKFLIYWFTFKYLNMQNLHFWTYFILVML